MRDTMSPALKAEWVAALRSGKYRQGAGRLAGQDSQGKWYHCCLGVACELFAERAGVDVEIDRIWIYRGPVKRWGSLGSVTALPGEISEFMGLRGYDQQNPLVKVGDVSGSLAALNDAGYSFEQIADLIEEQL